MVFAVIRIGHLEGETGPAAHVLGCWSPGDHCGGAATGSLDAWLNSRLGGAHLTTRPVEILEGDLQVISSPDFCSVVAQPRDGCVGIVGADPEDDRFTAEDRVGIAVLRRSVDRSNDWLELGLLIDLVDR